LLDDPGSGWKSIRIHSPGTNTYSYLGLAAARPAVSLLQVVAEIRPMNALRTLNIYSNVVFTHPNFNIIAQQSFHAIFYIFTRNTGMLEDQK
jgi:hypothetical protein